MKKLLLIGMIFAFVALLTGCTAKNELDAALEQIPTATTQAIPEEAIFEGVKTFGIIHGPCGTITYQNRIGNDFSQALDSLIKLDKPFLEGLTSDEYYVEKETVTVDFNYDDRLFSAIGFRRIKDGVYIFSLSSVLDSKGNHFVINWCED
ncbi:MAG: hypothetical protein LBQ39_06300 [Tannerellaceae bacterium]|jgi:hypothetical protein|nr:hypothetical protein [Tannerellaceae bacterium]